MLAQFLALPVVLCTGAVALAQQKSAFSVKTRLVDASVEIDERLKAYPGLEANCVADAKRWIERMRGEAEKERREDIALFREAQRWTLERSYEQRSAIGRYVSVLRTDEIDTGEQQPRDRHRRNPMGPRSQEAGRDPAVLQGDRRTTAPP